jgi:hypothetical protein
MKILMDSYYEIGSNHIVCEDYARTGKFSIEDKDYHYAIVSDGCSSSKDTDVGSRLLTLLAHNALVYAYLHESTTEYRSKSFKEQMKIAIQNCSTMFSASITPLMFDATLVIAVTDGLKTEVYMYGDGVIILRTAEGISHTFTMEYLSNAPYYISYEALSKSRNADYQRQFKGMEKFFKSIHHKDKSEHSCNSIPTEDTYRWIDNVAMKLQSISVFSDGVHTFTKDREKLDLYNVCNEFTNFKNVTGDFVSRRLLAYKRQCLKDNIKHDDDISIATLYFEQE